MAFLHTGFNKRDMYTCSPRITKKRGKKSSKNIAVTYGLARRSETDGRPVLLHASSLKIDNKTDPVD